MAQKTKKSIHLVYSILLSLLLIVTGINLCLACVGIYLSGDKPFSPESVAAAFSGIAVPVYLCIVLVFLGFVLDAAPGNEKKKPTLQKQYAAILRRLYEKTDMRYAAPHIQAEVKALQKKRTIIKGITLGLLAVGTVIFLSYGLNSHNFHQTDITGSMVKAMTLFIPCLVVPFAWGIFAAYYERNSLIAETELVKQVIATGAKAAPAEEAAKKNPRFYLSAVRYGLLVVAVAILVYGYLTGGTQDVLTKAINICTECVGLG